MTLSNDPEEFFQDPQEPMADANTQAIIDAVTTGIMQLQNAITMVITNAMTAPPAGPFLRTPLQAKVNDTMTLPRKKVAGTMKWRLNHSFQMERSLMLNLLSFKSS